ncbi:uncharacterized protein LOC131180704 [Hevea brasiliensis]|uniref:uncharacterized protein LOC131180704 n=1 Tax=Hevea brasiliensis TaxID=3981 RepID=UPI0025E62172|nr:uncharacterized protein LOC131180704 [Hevea brasiliensis]
MASSQLSGQQGRGQRGRGFGGRSGVTVPSSTDPSIQQPNPEFENWFRKDQMLLSWLLSSLTEEIYPYIIGLTSSKAVWDALANAFRAELKKHDLSVSQFLQKAKALSDELSAAGRPISQAEFNAIIYRNIGSEYHGLIAALNLCSEPMSFNELYGQLVAHEILLKGSLDPVANLVLKGNSPTPVNQFQSNNSTFTPQQRQSNNNSGRRRQCGPCQICGLSNHSAIT